MGQLVELIFEDLTSSQAKDVCEFIARSNSKNKEEKINDSHLVNLETDCLEEPLFELIISSETTILNVHLRLLKYKEQSFDVEMNFDLNDVVNTGKIHFEVSLFNFSRSIAKRYGIDKYFAGLEPASDVNTRFFTKDELGPYNLPR